MTVCAPPLPGVRTETVRAVVGEHECMTSFDICSYCGTTFGYQDATPVAVQKQRAR